MATTTTTPTPTVPITPSVENRPVNFTPNAIGKVKEIMAQQNPVPAGLRVGVVGGGCSGFSYSMSFENGAGMMDKTFDFDGLKVFVDATSRHVLERRDGRLRRDAGRRRLQVRDPNVKSTCGCGSSFSV